ITLAICPIMSFLPAVSAIRPAMNFLLQQKWNVSGSSSNNCKLNEQNVESRQFANERSLLFSRKQDLHKCPRPAFGVKHQSSIQEKLVAFVIQFISVDLLGQK